MKPKISKIIIEQLRNIDAFDRFEAKNLLREIKNIKRRVGSAKKTT